MEQNSENYVTPRDSITTNTNEKFLYTTFVCSLSQIHDIWGFPLCFFFLFYPAFFLSLDVWIYSMVRGGGDLQPLI